MIDLQIDFRPSVLLLNLCLHVTQCVSFVTHAVSLERTYGQITSLSPLVITSYLYLSLQVISCKISFSPLTYIRLPKIKEWIDANDPGALLIPFSGALESRLIDMPDDERQRELTTLGITRYALTTSWNF